MEFRNMATEMTEKEIITALYIVLPDSIFKSYKRMSDYIQVWYALPNDEPETEHRLDLLPDDIYFIDDFKEACDTPVSDGDILFRYYQLMVAKGYSLIWKGNPFIL